jgi:hypothetical protein
LEVTVAITPAFQPVKGHEERDLHDIIAARVASWWWGGSDEDIGGYLSTAKLIARDPIHEAIYLARIADDSSKFRQLKDWAYREAAEFAMTKGAGIRKRTVIESYSPKWGHQAARDGMARALWPWLEHEMPGRDARCQQTNAGHQAYMRVRDEIQSRTLDGFIAYMFDLKCLVEGRWTRDMIDRWEAATGADFSRAAI